MKLLVGAGAKVNFKVKVCSLLVVSPEFGFCCTFEGEISDFQRARQE
jgi:hypothetical protein